MERRVGREALGAGFGDGEEGRSRIFINDKIRCLKSFSFYIHKKFCNIIILKLIHDLFLNECKTVFVLGT